MDKDKMIAIVDYGAGNLRSVANAIAKLIEYHQRQERESL